MSGDEPTRAPAARKKRMTRARIDGAVIEVTPGDDVNPVTLAAWLAENVELPAAGGLTIVRVTSWVPPRWADDVTPPHPAPEVPCRLATEDEIPRGAKPVRLAAEGAGWRVVATYARGSKWTKSGPGALVDSLALRMWRDGRRAVAIWLNGRFNYGLRWGTGFRPECLGVKELTAWLVTS